VQEIGCISSTNVRSLLYGNLQLPNELPTTNTYRVKENRKRLTLSRCCFTNTS